MIEDTEEPIPVLIDLALSGVADVEVGAITSLDGAVLREVLSQVSNVV